MTRKTLKGAMLIAVLGTLCQFGSCLTKGLMNSVTYVGLEFVADSDQVFDLFAD